MIITRINVVQLCTWMECTGSVAIHQLQITFSAYFGINQNICQVSMPCVCCYNIVLLSGLYYFIVVVLVSPFNPTSKLLFHIFKSLLLTVFSVHDCVILGDFCYLQVVFQFLTFKWFWVLPVLEKGNTSGIVLDLVDIILGFVKSWFKPTRDKSLCSSIPKWSLSNLLYNHVIGGTNHKTVLY